MSKRKNTPTKVVSTASNLKATTSKKTSAPSAPITQELVFKKENYILIGIGLLLIVLGMFMMSGGEQAPTEWNEEELFGFWRIGFPSMLILAGLLVQVFAIFKK